MIYGLAVFSLLKVVIAKQHLYFRYTPSVLALVEEGERDVHVCKGAAGIVNGC